MKIAYAKIIAILLVSCLGIVIYSNTFQNSFQFDDEESIVKNINITNLSNLKTIWDFWPTRFLTYLSISINYHFSKLNIFSYHLFNLIVHLACAILVWWLVYLTVGWNLFAFFCALIFVAHPLQTQAVSYIIQRSTSLATFFYLGCLGLYVKARVLQEEKKSALSIKFFYSCSFIAGLLAMFSKEMASTLPLIILLYEFTFLKTKKTINWKTVFPFLLLPLAIPLTMWLSRSVNFLELRRITSLPAGISPTQYLLTQFRVILTYFRLLIIPLNQNLDYDYPLAKSAFTLQIFTSLLVLILILFLAARLFSKAKLISFGIFWFFITLIPESSIFPIQDVIVEHRLYLPMVGFSFFLVAGIFYILGARHIKKAVILLLIIVAGYSFLTYQRNLVWKDEFTLWNDVVNKSKNKARSYCNRGIAYFRQGDYARAITDFNQAVSLNPDYAQVYLNRGITYFASGDYAQAISDYNSALKLKPDYADAYTLRGLLYTSQGNYDQAISDYNQAIKINPNTVKAYLNRGIVYGQKGNFNQAVLDYTQAINLKPDYADAYYNRAVTYFYVHEYAKAQLDVEKFQKLGGKPRPQFLKQLERASGR